MKKCYFVVLLSVATLLGCVNRDEIYANPPEELVQQVNGLLSLAEDFVLAKEKEAIEKGIPLTSYQLEVAKKIGLKHPEKVRIYYVNKLPFPSDPTLAALARKYGYSSPMMGAYTYGYGIWMKKAAKGDRELMSHELIHVRQAEQLGLMEQTKQYLMQLFIYGYAKAPMELEAYSEASKYI